MVACVVVDVAACSAAADDDDYAVFSSEQLTGTLEFTVSSQQPVAGG